MLLRTLKEYADERMNLPPPFYKELSVRYIIELDDTGQVRSRQLTDTADPANKQKQRGEKRVMPQIVRPGTGAKPLLLMDNAEYVFGIPKSEKSKPERVQECHKAFVDLVQQCAEATQEPAVQAVATFLGDNPQAKIQLPADFVPTDNITFRVNGTFPTELPRVRDFWVAEQAKKDAEMMQCIVCGQQRPVRKTLPKVDGIPGGQSSGNAIISANKEAFESYGLTQSLIAPTCTECAEHFTQALNKLLRDERNRVRLAGAVFVFWTREEVGFHFGSMINDPKPEQVKALLETVHHRRWMPEVDDVAFYATLLSASGTRVVVRDWADTTVQQVKENLARWFRHQAIVDDYGKDALPISLNGLAAATVPEKKKKKNSPTMKDLPTITIRWLLNSSVLGSPVPLALLYQAIRRNRAEQRVTRNRAALIKMVLIQQDVIEEDTMEELELTNTDPAYCCGRLLAVLAEVQEVAIGKAAIVDRFYGTASSAPASVFPRLMRGVRYHFAKLERDKPNIAFVLERRIEEITQHISAFPAILALKDQGLFALGFYHQRAHSHTKMMAASKRKKEAQEQEQEQQQQLFIDDGTEEVVDSGQVPF